jgi:hypothetical protein
VATLAPDSSEPLDQEEYRRKLYAPDPNQSVIGAMLRSAKSGVDHAMGSASEFLTGGKWSEFLGYDEEKEGRSYQDHIDSVARGQQVRNDAFAKDSLGLQVALGAANAAGEMAPAMVAGGAGATGLAGRIGAHAATGVGATAAASSPVWGAMTATFGPQYFAEAKRAGKSNMAAAGVAGTKLAIDIGLSLIGGVVAGKLGGKTVDNIFSNQAVKGLTGRIAGTAVEGGEEVAANFFQGLTDVVSGVNPDAMKDLQSWKTFLIAASLGAAANTVDAMGGPVGDFLETRSRSNARKLGIPPEMANSKTQREALAEQIQVVSEKPPMDSQAEPAIAQPQPQEAPQGPTVDEAMPPAETELTAERESPYDATSARKAWMAQDRELLGLDALPEAEQVLWQQDLDAARERNIPQNALGIAQSIIANPRGLDSTETAGLVVHAAELKNAHEATAKLLDQNSDPADFDTATAELNRIEQDFDVLSQALRMSGTEKGRALAAQKLTIARDYSLLTLKARAKAAKKDQLTNQESRTLTSKVENLAVKERQLQKAIESAHERLTELETHLEAGTLPPPKPNKRTQSKELQDLRDMIAAVRRSMNQSEAAKRQRLEATIAKLEARLAAGDFSLPGHAPAPLSKDIERLEYERDKLRREIDKKIQELKPKSPWRKYVSEPSDVIRTNKTMIDLPPILRQGGAITFGNPVLAYRGAKSGIQSIKSDQQARKMMREIGERHNAPLYARSKLYLADMDATRNKQEEAFMGELGDKIPYWRVAKDASARNYIVSLNTMRADLFDLMAANVTRNGEPAMEEARDISRYINVASGRGDFEGQRMDNALAELATVFFSPRYVASRFQYMTLQPLWKAKTAAGRKAVAREYAKTLSGIGVVLAVALAAGAEIEDDGKLKVGERRLDLMFGLVQNSRLIKDDLKGFAATAKSWWTGHRPAPTYAERMRYTRFLRSKLAPIPAAYWDFKEGRDYENSEVTPGSMAKNLFAQLSLEDLHEEVSKEGVGPGLALWVVSLFGMGLQNYKENPAELDAL